MPLLPQQSRPGAQSLDRSARRKGRGRKKALVALARKLAVILHAMLRHGRDFDETIQATAAATA